MAEKNKPNATDEDLPNATDEALNKAFEAQQEFVNTILNDDSSDAIDEAFDNIFEAQKEHSNAIINEIIADNKKDINNNNDQEATSSPEFPQTEEKTVLADKETTNQLAAILGGVQNYVQKKEEHNKNLFSELLNKAPNELTSDEINFLKNYSRDGLTENDNNKLSAIFEALQTEQTDTPSSAQQEQSEPERQNTSEPVQAQNDKEKTADEIKNERFEKLQSLTPENRLAVALMLRDTSKENTDLLLDLALETQQETPNNDNFINNLTQKAQGNGNFSDNELTIMSNITTSTESMKTSMSNQLNTILSNGIENMSQADIDMLDQMAFFGIESDRVNEALKQHQTYLDSQVPEAELNTEQDQDEQGDDLFSDQDQDEQGDDLFSDQDQELDEYLDELQASDNEENYLNEISPKIKPAAIEAAMALEGTANQALALANPEDMLVAYDYYETKYKGDDKDDKIESLTEVIRYNLGQYGNEDINPENAFVLLTLANKIKDETSLYTNITENIATALKEYDEDTFGKPQIKEDGQKETREEQATRLEKNYNEGLAALESLNAYDTMAMLDDYTFTDNNNTPLTDKNRSWVNPNRWFQGKGNALTNTKESIIETARLMVAKDLAKDGLPQDIKDANGNVIKTVDDQLLEKMQEKVNQIMTPAIDDKVIEAVDGILLASDELRDPLSEDFKKERNDYIKKLQKGDETAIRAVADYLTRQELGLSIDEELDKKTKKAYNKKLKANTNFVKANVFYTQSNIGARLGGAMVAGPETFKTRIAQKFRNTNFYKTAQGRWKTLDEKLDKRFGKAYRLGKKIAKFATQMAPGIAKNAAMYGLAGMVPGGIPALIVYNTCKQWKQMSKSLQDPSISKTKKWCMLAGAGITTALGTISAATGLDTVLRIAGVDTPAIMQFATNVGSYLGMATRTAISTFAVTLPNWVEKFALNRKEKKLKEELAKETDPQKIKELIEKQKKIDIQKHSNNDDLLKKGIGVAIGIGCSQLTASAAKQIHGQNTPDELLGKKAEGAENPAATENDTKAAATENDTKAATTENDTKAAATENDTKAATTENETKAATAEKTATTEKTAATASAETGAKTEAYSANTEKTAPETQTTNNNDGKVEEAKAAEEAKAKNLAAASEKGSGHLGKSDMESMQKDLDSRHGELMNFSAEEKAALMKALATGYGTNSYEAMHAAMAEPNILAHAMGLEGNYTSASLLNHMAAHPELAENAGFKAYVAEHFDSQDRFHYSNSSTPQQVQNQAPASEPAPTQAPQEQTLSQPEPQIIYTPAEEYPAQPEPQVVYVEHTPPANTSANNGLIYDPMLSEGLNHSKYQGAYIDPNRIIDGKPAVVYLPVDPLHDKPHITNMDDAVKAHDLAGGDTLGIYRSPTGTDLNNPENNSHYGYGYGGGARVCYGSGGISHTTVSTRDISFGEALGQQIAVRVADVALRQGEHALSHVIENALGRGR